MDLPTWLSQNWELVRQNLLALLILAFVVAGLAAVITKAVIGGALEASRERLAAAQDEASRLKGEKSELLKRLQQHGEDIDKLKSDLAALPRVHVSNRAPQSAEGKHGDLWARVDATPDSSPRLSQLEKQLLARVAKADGRPVPMATLKRSLGTTNLRLQAAIDRLGELQLIEALQDPEDDEDVVLLLTARGRQDAIDRGLA